MSSEVMDWMYVGGLKLQTSLCIFPAVSSFILLCSGFICGMRFLVSQIGFLVSLLVSE